MTVTETSTTTAPGSTGTSPTTHQMIFVNLPVADVTASRAFFTALGYGFDETMCNDQGLALSLGPNLYAMLLRRDFFARFHGGSTAGTGSHEVLTCLSATSREEVDRLVDAAVAAGGVEQRSEESTEEATDFMYWRSYADLDGHIWEIMWMDVEAATAAGVFG